MTPGRGYQIVSWGSAALVAAVLIGLWFALLDRHLVAIGPGLAGQIDRKTIVPLFWIEVIGFASIGVALIAIAVSTWRRRSPVLWQETVDAVRAERARRAREGGPSRLGPAFGEAAREIAGGGMADCEDAQQWFAHLLIMWGFIGLMATTALDAVVNRPADPLGLLHPVRLLGNLTGILFMAGLTLSIVRRALLDHVRRRSALRDWIFLLALWATGATGFAVQWYADWALMEPTRWFYLLHLVFIVLILGAAPWTKMLHAVWRPSWAIYRALLLARRK